MGESLTAGQSRLLRAIEAWMVAHKGVPPTVAELAAALSIRGPSVYEQLGHLERKGWIRRRRGQARGIELVNPPEALRKRWRAEGEQQMNQTTVTPYRPASSTPYPIPMAGSQVAAGFPSPADDFVEGQLDLNQFLVKHPAATFFVRVSGDSMRDAGIHPGDILVVDRALEAEDGRIVIAVLNGELTVKRLKKRDGQVYLMPENPHYPPIEISEEAEMVIWGIVTSVVHFFS
uniref:Putative LexA repressor n=1 Tax=Magnetococcus massalia (strain MO-1) TaxID=451514 RepID=A0A1S7LHL7_MAGMO|nr:putative LexA repressor [Candidatus Magnetococcus massalia]